MEWGGGVIRKELTSGVNNAAANSDDDIARTIAQGRANACQMSCTHRKRQARSELRVLPLSEYCWMPCQGLRNHGRELPGGLQQAARCFCSPHRELKLPHSCRRTHPRPRGPKRATIATATSPGRSRKAEQTVLTILANLEHPPYRSYATDYGYPSLAGRVATICEITRREVPGCLRPTQHCTGSSHRDAASQHSGCLAPPRSLKGTDSDGDIARAIAKGRANGARNDRTDRKRRARPYYGVEMYPKIAGCLVAICKITRESFRKACERLHIYPAHRTEMLNLQHSDRPTRPRPRGPAKYLRH